MLTMCLAVCCAVVVIAANCGNHVPQCKYMPQSQRPPVLLLQVGMLLRLVNALKQVVAVLQQSITCLPRPTGFPAVIGLGS